MKILYFDCFSGISGDMTLGAMLDLGVDKDYFLSHLAMLGLENKYEICISKGQKKGITGTKVGVKLLNESTQNISGSVSHKRHGRTLGQIQKIISQSRLPDSIKNRSLKMFEILAQAEAKIHGVSVEEVHFHEVGAVDALVDIVGVSVCLEYLQVERILASSVELGGGFVHCAHGVLPVPVPAVTEILQGVPVKIGKVEFETTTPTGAAILVANVDKYTDKLDFKIRKTGYGLGQRDLEIPNVLRVYLADLIENSSEKTSYSVTSSKSKELSWHNETQWMLETNIDDMNPELLPYVEKKLFAAGALDVFKTPIIMKKGRSAVKLSVLADREVLPAIKQIIFCETTAIGLRSYPVEKTALTTKIEKIETKYGVVSVKFSYLNGNLLKYKAENQDCLKIAEEQNIPLNTLYTEVESAIAKNKRK